MSNQIQPYGDAPARGAGRRRDSPVFDGLPGESMVLADQMGPAPGNAQYAMGNSLQPRDKMAQYRDAALVPPPPLCAFARPRRPTAAASPKAPSTTDGVGWISQDFYNNGQVQGAPGDIPLAGVPGMDLPDDQMQGSLADMLANVRAHLPPPAHRPSVPRAAAGITGRSRSHAASVCGTGRPAGYSARRAGHHLKGRFRESNEENEDNRESNRKDGPQLVA